MTDQPINYSIAFVLPYGLTLGGVPIWCVQLSQHLLSKGYRPVLIEHAPPEGYAPLPVSVADGLQRLVCGEPDVTSAGADSVPGFAEVYRQALPATIVPNMSSVAYAACALLSRSASHTIRVLGVGHAEGQAVRDELCYYESIIHTFIAVSDEVDSELRKCLPHRQEDIVVRPCGVEIPSDLQRGYSAEDEPLRLVYAGRIVAGHKRMSDMVPLLKALSRRRIDFRVRIVGEGPYKEWLKYEVSQLDPDSRDRVSIEDSVPPHEMPRVWQWADLGILLSEFEGTAMSMMEAMGHGCVPVVTRVSGTEALIKDGENGFTVPVGDVDAMADRIAALAADRGKLRQMATRARRSVASTYSHEQYVPWFLDLVDRVWQAPPRRWPDGKAVLMPGSSRRGSVIREWLNALRGNG